MQADMSLAYSSPKWQETLKSFQHIKDNMSKLTLDPYPDDKVLAAFAKLAYTDCEGKLELPEGWQLLTTAQSKKSQRNGYFGCALWNPSEQQIVIAHRGTNPKTLGALWIDGRGVYCTKYTNHMNSCVSFADEIKKVILETNQRHGSRFVLSFTGHSLGAWLAGVTTMTVKHLKRAGNGFCRISNPGEGLHAHTLALDSPGVEDILIKISRDYDVRYDRSMCTKTLDITTFFAAPNMVNSTGFHVGYLKQFYTERVARPGESEEPSRMSNIDTHKIDKFIDAFSTGKETYIVQNWPQGFSEREYYHELEIFCNSYVLLDGEHSVLEVVQDGLVGKQGVLESEQKSPTSSSGGCKNTQPVKGNADGLQLQDTILQYKTTPSQGNTGHLGIFSIKEFIFIQNWSLYQNNALLKLTEIEKFASHQQLEKLDFPKFTMDTRRNTISCESRADLVKVIGQTKQLLRWFPAEIMDAVNKENRNIKSAPLYLASQAYLRTLPDILDCNDTFDLETFLESKEQHVLQIETNDLKFEASRLKNILFRIERTSLNSKYLNHTCHTFVGWNDMAGMAKNIDLEGLHTSDVTIDNLLVLEFTPPEDNLHPNYDILRQILTNLKTCGHKKLVIICLQSFDSQILMDYNLTIEIKPLKDFELSDLTLTSREKIFERDTIALGEEKLNLKNLLGDDYKSNDETVRNKINQLISPILKNLLMDNQFIQKIPNKLPRLYELDALYSKGNQRVDQSRIFSLLERTGEDGPLFVISDPEELSQDYWGEMAEITRGRIFTSDEDSQDLFLEKCREEQARVIYWLHLCDEGLTLREVYNRGLYMPRKFHTRLIIKSMDEFVRYRGNKDLFIINNVEDKISLISFFNLSAEAQELFVSNDHFKIKILSDELNIGKRNKEDSLNKHYLKMLEIGDRPCLEWQYSHGSLDGLRPFITKDYSDPIEEGAFCITKKKMNIIADDPGMGKTTSLTRMSELIRDSWVLRFDQKNLTSAIDKLPSKLNMKKVTDCLIRASDLPTDNVLLRSLLQHCLESDSSKGVCVLIDAFDEITEDKTKSKFVELLKYLKNSTTCITVVTTRAYPQEGLENDLGEFSVELKRISEIEQENYMVNSWLSHLALEVPNYGNQEKRGLRQFARGLREEAEKMLGKDVGSFMGIPLQIRMLAEVFIQQAILYVISPEQGQNLCKITNLFDLYKQFIEVKKSIFFEQKNNLNKRLPPTIWNDLITNIMEKHSVLAFQSLDPKFAAEYFTNTIKSNQALKDISSLGLIQATNTKEIFPFIHRTFEEYFCADFFVQWLKEGKQTKDNNILVKSEMTLFLLKSDYFLIRKFIETQLDISPPIPSEVLESKLIFYQHWSEHSQLFFHDYENTPLHVAIEEQNRNTITVLLSCPSSRISDEAYISFLAARNKTGRTALSIALENQNLIIANQITEHVKVCSNNSILKIMLATFLDMGIYRDDKLFKEYCLNTQLLISINKALMRTVQVRKQMNPFVAAVREDDYETVQKIFSSMESDIERAYLSIAVDSRGDTAINLATSKKDHTLFKLFAEHGVCVSYDKLEQNPLHRAAEEGHISIVTYLLNQSKETYDDIGNDNHIDKELTASQQAGKYEIFSSINSKDKVGNTALQLAAQRGHYNIVNQLLEKGADIHIRNADGWTAFISAAYSGHPKIVELLLMKGADLNSRDIHNECAFLLAASNGHHNTLVKLLEKGADIHIANKKGWTALNYAAAEGHLDVIELLLLNGADSNHLDVNGNSAFIHAASYGQADIVCKLLEKGANINATNNYGWAALDGAAAQGHLEVAELLLLKGADFNSRDIYGDSALLHAANSGHAKIVSKLLKKGADIHTRNNKGWTTLITAANNGHLEVAEVLFLNGADLNSQDETGVSALIQAAAFGHLDMVRKLLEKGADNNLRNINGWTALNCATAEGYLEVAELLVLKGANLNSQDEIGFSSLLHAARGGHADVVCKLLEKGADINTRSNKGSTALICAAGLGRLAVVELLLRNEADFNSRDENGYTALLYAVSNGHVDIVCKLLEKGADVQTSNNNGLTALHIAAIEGYVEIAELLLMNGADLNFRCINGDSALLFAACGGHTDTVNKLLERGADIHTVNNKGWTALIYAAAGGNTEVVDLLLLNGANLGSQDEDGISALLMAAKNGHQDTVQILVETGVDIHTSSNDGFTAFNYAATQGHLKVAELLLQNGADVNSQNVNGDSALLLAASNGHAYTVRKLMEKGADIHIRNSDGWTALISAAKNGHLEVAELLLLYGADLKSRDDKGFSALLQAAANGHHDVLQKLLKKGADIYVRDNIGHSSLNYAAAFGHLRVVELLLLNGADINSQNVDGDSPLLLAAAHGHYEVVGILLNKGADIHISNYNSRNALILAANSGHLEVIDLLLLNGADLNSRDVNGVHALLHAATNGHRDIVLRLLEKKVDIHTSNNNGWTALMLAAQKGRQEIVELILIHGPDLNSVDVDGDSALLHAVCGGHNDIVSTLLEKGADVNTRNNSGLFALSYAAALGNPEVVELLLLNGADLNIRYVNGECALLLAACGGHTDIVRKLLEKGADIHTKNNKGWTALNYAAAQGHLEVTKLLLLNGADLNSRDEDGDSALLQAAANGHHNTVDKLLENGADLNTINNAGWTALSYAATFGQVNVAELLLLGGADLNHRDKDGDSALLHAASSGKTDMVAFLIQCGVDVNSQRDDGRTALTWAALKGQLNVVEILLQNNADVSCQDKNGKTALSWAEENGHREVVDLLRSHQETSPVSLSPRTAVY